MRCTEAALRAIGIEDKCPRFGTGVLQYMTEAGMTWRVMMDAPRTVKSFVRKHPKGCYYISTAGHAMALVNGVLTDTTGRGADKRRLIGAFEIEGCRSPT